MDAQMRTRRLVLRPLAGRDARALHALWSQPDVARVLHPTGAPSIERVQAWIERTIAHSPAVFAVEARERRGIVGYCGLQSLPETGEPELFYGFAPDAWGQDLATEAGEAVLRHAAGALGMPRVVAIVSPTNLRSARVLEKLGFERDGQMLHAGAPHVRYALELHNTRRR